MEAKDKRSGNRQKRWGKKRGKKKVKKELPSFERYPSKFILLLHGSVIFYNLGVNLI